MIDVNVVEVIDNLKLILNDIEEERVPSESQIWYAKLIKDSLHKLRKFEPRVLTYDEVLETVRAGGFYWIETGSAGESNDMYYLRCQSIERGFQQFEYNFASPHFFSIYGSRNYNKQWRIWTDMPSAEQMKEAAWDV